MNDNMRSGLVLHGFYTKEIILTSLAAHNVGMSKILIIEDEHDIAEVLEYNLIKEGHKVFSALDGIKGLAMVYAKKPDLIILDLMLPGISGIEVCRKIRSDPEICSTPVLILSAKGSETDKIGGFETGADDYVTKPFSVKEMLARVTAILKRCRGGNKFSGKIKFKGVEIDPEKHIVTIQGDPIDLTVKEFKLLETLASSIGQAFSRKRLLQEVWGIEADIETRTVDVHMRRLRKKLKKISGYFDTVHGVGYRFNPK